MTQIISVVAAALISILAGGALPARTPVPARAKTGEAGTAEAADIKSLVRAELAFSRLSEAQGIRTAFLANFAEEAIVFRPRPVLGLKLYRDRTSIPGYLSWGPAYAFVAASGELGYTTGPYEMRKEKADDPVTGRGHFISIWRLQKDGEWKVVFDSGIAYTVPFTAERVLDPGRIAEGAAASVALAGGAGRAEQEIAVAEKALTTASTTGGAKALAEAMAAEVRLYFDGAHPLKGRAAAGKALAQKPGRLSWDIQAVHASAAGDLGYVYGVTELAPAAGAASPAETSSFLHIWRKGASGRWEIVLCIFSPVK
jgi:ketosteroid isomerase-like protein